jgi:anti-sigma factor RsiW
MRDYLSGEMEPGPRADFERHLSRCVNCRRYLTGYEETVKLGRRAFDHEDDALPDDVPAELVTAILASRRTQSGNSGNEKG